MTDLLRNTFSVAGIIAVWWLITGSGMVNADLFPTPYAVATAAQELYSEGLLFTDLAVSIKRAAIGFAIGALLGVVMGILTARVAILRLIFNPLFNLLRPIPAIALVPLAIVWLGIGQSSKYFVISYTVFLGVWLNTHHGTEHVARTYILAARSLGANRLREFVEVILPAAAPHIVAGLRIGAALAFLSLVAAELSGASAGIGFRLQEARQFIRTDRMFVGLLELGVLGAILDFVFVLTSRKLVHWEHT